MAEIDAGVYVGWVAGAHGWAIILYGHGWVAAFRADDVACESHAKGQKLRTELNLEPLVRELPSLC